MARGRKSALHILLSPKERETLEHWQRSTTIAVHLRIFWPADLVLANLKLPVIPESRDTP
jgi:hypothetical protein